MDSERVPAEPANSLSSIWLQLFILGAFRATEAIAWTSIFPYVYFMIKSFDEVKDAEIPFYAGMLVAVFTFCEFLSGMAWARVSDWIGRKPTLLIGSLCGIIAAISFGLSKSMAAAALSRAVGGLTNPNVGVVQTCIGELATRKEQQARAFSVVPLLRGLGALLGPPLGGLLADPVKLYPGVFRSSIWEKFPYLLPNVTVGILSFSSMVLGFLCFQETHPQLSKRPDIGICTIRAVKHILTGKIGKWKEFGYSRLDDDDKNGIELTQETEMEPQLVGERVQESTQSEHVLAYEDDVQPAEKTLAKPFTLQVILQIVSVSLLAFHKVSSDIITPTFLAIPAKEHMGPEDLQATSIFRFVDGFGFSSQKIGLILLTQAGVAIAAQTTLVPFIVGWLGALKTYRLVLCVFPATYLLTPFLVKLKPVFSTVVLLLDLWVKVVLSSTGYVCSAIL
ncbi:hypothetical protein PRK78_000529 [Emydomyces testavorans]|uniref:Major facilitator superfamily (MFS) profile domain-containing protein n=1 Tax=Emydomyces testavorans TaxID=2070801 RepID=A0AAF0DBX9_9EURO|nr:hypothetical protein PRK78_000529 [Emydomyces testavorans]